MQRARTPLLICLCLALLIPARADGQLRTATIRGQVFGQFLRGAHRYPVSAVVRVLDSSGSSVKAVYADHEGRYEIDGLVPGAYVVTVSKVYFVDQKRKIVAAAGKTSRLNITLKEPSPQSACPSKPEAPPFPTDLRKVTMMLKRTSACLSPCPTYTIDISGDGRVKYVGIASVPHVGALSYSISPSQFQKLVAKFYKAEFFSLCRDYSTHWTDLPGSSTSIQIGSTTWAVEDYGLVGPKRLQSLNSYIDKIAGPTRQKRK